MIIDPSHSSRISSSRRAWHDKGGVILNANIQEGKKQEKVYTPRRNDKIARCFRGKTVNIYGK